MMELLYENKSLTIDDGYIRDMKIAYVKLCVGPLEGNSVWDPFFPFKLLRDLKVEYGNGGSMFRTNGMFIMATIEMAKPELRKTEHGYICDKGDLVDVSRNGGQFMVPVFMKTRLPNNPVAHPYITLDLDTYQTAIIEAYIVTDFYAPMIPIMDSAKVKANVNQAEIIHVPETATHVQHTVHMDGFIEYLLVYVDDGIKVSSMDIIACNVSRYHSYEEMNSVLPYYYLGRGLPKNYLFISFSQNEQGGLNLNRLEQFAIAFTLKKNNGGSIYVMSESRNVLAMSNTDIMWDFTTDGCMDNYEWKHEMGVDDGTIVGSRPGVPEIMRIKIEI